MSKKRSILNQLSVVSLSVLPRVYKRGTESVVFHIALYKHTLKSTKVKLRNTTQNILQMSGWVTARMRVVEMGKLCAMISAM